MRADKKVFHLQGTYWYYSVKQQVLKHTTLHAQHTNFDITGSKNCNQCYEDSGNQMSPKIQFE